MGTRRQDSVTKKPAGFLGFYPLSAAIISVKYTAGYGKTQLLPPGSWVFLLNLLFTGSGFGYTPALLVF